MENINDEWTLVRKKERKHNHPLTYKEIKYLERRNRAKYYLVVNELTNTDLTLIEEYNKTNNSAVFCVCCCRDMLTDIIKKNYYCNGCFCCGH